MTVDKKPGAAAGGKDSLVAGPHACPFYGLFGTRHGLMLQMQGNGCALTYAHAPCAREVDGERPDWDSCSTMNTPSQRATLTSMMDAVDVGPNGGSSMSLRDWFRTVMGRDFAPGDPDGMSGAGQA